MERTLEIFLFLLPTLTIILCLSAAWYYYLRFQRNNAEQKRQADHSASLLKIRLQAYERLVLFLERISPQHLVVRNNELHIPAMEMQHNMVNNIREEYEHNLVQQIYVSEKAWSGVVQARIWVLKLINEAAGSLPEGTAANDLAIAIVAAEMKAKENYLAEALSFLTNEVRELF